MSEHDKQIFEAVVDAVGEALLTIDTDGVVVMCNGAACRLWELERAQIVGESCAKLVDPDQIDTYARQLEDQLARGATRDASYEFHGRRSNNTIFPAELRLSVTEHGGRQLYIAAVRDTTRRKEREDRLRESEESFRTLLDSIFEGIFIHDEGVLLEANQQAADLTGYPKNELRGMRMALLTADSLAGEGEPESRDVAEFADVIEAVGVGKEGRTLDLEILTKRIRYLGRRVWVSAFRDVSAYKEKERELRRRLESEDLIASISSRFINIDATEMHTAIADCLRRVGEFAGVDRSYLVVLDGDQMAQFRHEWSAPGVEPVFLENYDKRNPAAFSWFSTRLERGVVTRIDSLDDLPTDALQERELLTSMGIRSALFFPMFAGNQLVGFAGFHAIKEARVWREESINLLSLVGDILANALDRQRAQLALEEANVDLEGKVVERTRALKEKHAQLVQSEKMAALGQLVAGVAHEINTPLGAIKSNSDVLERTLVKLRKILADPDMPEMVREHRTIKKLLGGVTKLSAINEQAIERIVRIVSSLRKFARLDAAEVDSVDIHAGIDNTLTLIHHETKNRIEIKKDYGSLPLVECYPNQLNQVFMNLLVNASQAIEGKGTITIRTRVYDPEDRESVCVEVLDSGKGIPEADLARIFDPGFTTKGVGVGTGLGLSIVHQIVEDHSGRIEVESTQGEGTTFRVVLPTTLPAERARSIAPASPSARTGAAAT